MRFLLVATGVAWLGMGCATGIPPEQLQAQVVEAARWQREYESERERTEALAARLAAVESALEALALERAEAEQARALMVEELGRAEVERHSLEEHNAQLLARQRELAAMHEELSDVWYESALERARRRTLPPLPQGSSAEGGAAADGGAGGGGGASP